MNTLELITVFFTAVMFWSNLTVIKTYSKTNSVGNTSIYPFLSTFINCSLWVKYGILSEEPVVYSVNSFGLIVSVVCMYFYHKYSEDKSGTERALLYGFLFITACLSYVRFGFNYIPDVLDHLGFLACTFSIIMFGAPLFSISTVLKTKNAAGHISLEVASLSLLVTILWTCVGAHFRDSFIIIPNALGIALSVVQLVVYWMFKPTSTLLPTRVPSMEETETRSE